MDNLPDHLMIDILSRLDDSPELARCKLTSKTLYKLARHVRSIHLYCSLDRFTKMRSPETMSRVTPFMKIFDKIISEAEAPIESVSLGIEEPLELFNSYGRRFEERSHDLFLTGGPFSYSWMTKIGDGLKSISISDFLPQSYGRKTNILEVISYHCQRLVELKLKNSYLFVDDMIPMPLLTSLTLTNVNICNNYLIKLMECLPCLQILNLIDLGDNDPKIHHSNLKELKLKWMLSDCSETLDIISSITIHAPNLTKLVLECMDSFELSIHAPLLSDLHLAVERAVVLDVKMFMNIKTLSLVSSNLYYVIFNHLPFMKTVQNLTLGLPKCGPIDESKTFKLSKVFVVLPNVTSLTLGSEVWSKQMWFSLTDLAKGSCDRSRMRGLKHITIYLVLDDIDKTLSFILYVMRLCKKLSDIVLFIHRDVDLNVAISFVLSCTSKCSKVRLRWGTWKEGTKDCCISNGIGGVAKTVQRVAR